MLDHTEDQCDVLLVGYEEGENLALRYLAAFLQQADIRVQIQPFGSSMKEQVLNRIHQCRPKIVGFSMIFQRMLYEFAELIHFLRENHVKAHFTMGGHFPTVACRHTLEAIDGLDSVVCCEGEETLLELTEQIDSPDHWKNIKGLAYKNNAAITVNEARPLLSDLDRLPFPLRSKDVYRKRGLGIRSIISSRGCFYDCSFCSIRQFYNEAPGPKRRCRTPANVVEEMQRLFNDQGVRIFIFEDDDFLINSPRHKKWIVEFVACLQKAELDQQIVWRISCRIDDIDADMLHTMKSAGLACVYLGIESGNDQGLNTFHKHYRVVDIYQSISLLEKLEMPYEFGFMILNPDCSFDTIQEDIEFLKYVAQTGHTLVHFTKMLPYAGTAIENRLKNEGRLTGGIDAPDYPYLDSRLELLQMFFTQAFHYRNFHRDGLVERLRDAKLDAIIIRKFYPQLHADRYYDMVCDLIRQSNVTCLEKMSMAVNFMKSRTEKQILENWWLLEKMAHEESAFESQQEQFLDSLISSIRI